jgi:hypothetical protein
MIVSITLARRSAGRIIDPRCYDELSRRIMVQSARTPTGVDETLFREGIS